MFSILFYISIPIVYLIHDFEEFFMRRKWSDSKYDMMIAKYPKVAHIFSTLKSMTQLEYGIVIFEQFLFLTMAVVWGIYADPIPMCALFWGFGIHLIITIIHSVLLRVCFPGTVTSVLLLPYFGFGLADLLHQYTITENVVMATCGFGVIFLNLTLMYLLMKKFSDL